MSKEKPVAPCPNCGVEGPQLARMGMADEYACLNDECAVSEYYDEERPWRGVTEQAREKFYEEAIQE